MCRALLEEDKAYFKEQGQLMRDHLEELRVERHQFIQELKDCESQEKMMIGARRMRWAFVNAFQRDTPYYLPHYFVPDLFDGLQGRNLSKNAALIELSLPHKSTLIMCTLLKMGDGGLAYLGVLLLERGVLPGIRLPNVHRLYTLLLCCHRRRHP